MISYCLDKQIDCGKLCEDIQKLIYSHNVSGPPGDKVLVITIKTITDEQPLIKNIEYHSDCPS